MSKTLIVGDVHLGRSISIGKPGFGTNFNSRVADQAKLLDWVLDQAIENHVEDMIFTGDIFEEAKPDYILLKIFLDFLKKCEIAEIEVHIIVGNHDIKRTGAHYTSILDIVDTIDSENIHVYKQMKTIHKDGVSFTLLPFRDRKSLDYDTHDEAIASLQERLPYELAEVHPQNDKVLIGHLAIEGSIFVGDEIDDAANELMCPLSLFQGYDFVWMGHVHKPQVRAKNPYIAHIGSLDISDFGEIDHNKIIVLYDSSLKTKFKEIKVPTRPLKKISLSVPADKNTTEYVVEQIIKFNKNDSLKDAIVRLEIKLDGLEAKNSDREEVEKTIYSYGAHYICNFSETRNVSVVPLAKQQEVDFQTLSYKGAIKIWAKQFKFASKEDKSAYLAEANTIIDKLSLDSK